MAMRRTTTFLALLLIRWIVPSHGTGAPDGVLNEILDQVLNIYFILN